jgi:phosphoserine phosphatase
MNDNPIHSRASRPGCRSAVIHFGRWEDIALKYRIKICVSITVGVLQVCHNTRAEETHAQAIIPKILETRQVILAHAGASSSNEFVFLAFWDFDGTILQGDCSEGLKSDGKWLYKGLAQLAIESGYSEIYPPVGGVERFWKDYRHMEEDIGKWLAYPFIPQMLRGAPLSDIHALSTEHFSHVLRNYYFRSSILMLKALEDAEIQCHIMSASADVFVDAAAPTLGLKVGRFHGIELRTRDGRLTEELVYPVTWSDGKTEKLISIVEETARRHPGKQVIVLAAFGNSYGTDGPFMKYVATQTLPAGKPIAVMINGGKPPPSYRGLFLQVQQNELRSAPTNLNEESAKSEPGAEGNEANRAP